MSAYKNVGGEKAYISQVSFGLAVLTLWNLYGSPKAIRRKLEQAKLPCKSIEIISVNSERDYRGHEILFYGVRIYGMSVADAFALPDWKEPL